MLISFLEIIKNAYVDFILLLQDAYILRLSNQYASGFQCYPCFYREYGGRHRSPDLLGRDAHSTEYTSLIA